MNKSGKTSTPDFLSRAKELYELKELERLGLTPDLPQRDIIINHMALLLKWNPTVGLVSKKDEENIFIRHFCDSLQPLLLFGFKKHATMLDIGAGGGFPSIPTRVFRPDLKLTMVDSNKKKAKFLEEVVKESNLENVTVFSGRVEAMPIPEKKFDYIVSRGLGSLKEFSDLAKPFLHPDGRMYTFKGKEFQKELDEITEGKKASGIKISEIAEYDLGNQIFGLKLVALEIISD